MNRFVKTALAIAAAGSASHAGTGDNEWTALDSEISGLASSLKQSQDGMGWGVLLRAGYSHSSDDIATGGAPMMDMPDVSGFTFNDVDLAFWGNQGSYSWRVSADIDGNTASTVSIPGSGTPPSAPTNVSVGDSLELEDAYVRWSCGGYFDAMVGNFKPRVTRSNSVDPEGLLFIDRTAIGSSFDSWDEGIGVSGSWEQAKWFAAIMNGSGSSNDLVNDGQGDTRDHFYLLRGEWDFGSGAGRYEGAMGSSDTLNGTVGLSFVNDDSVETMGDSDTNAFLLDFHGNASQLGFGGEIADINDDYVGWGTDEDFSNLASPLVIEPDSQPWNVYVSYQLTPEWEVGARYEDMDNSAPSSNPSGRSVGQDNSLLSLVVNWYATGNAGKWQLQYTDIEADETNAPDGSIVEVGYSIGLTR